MASSWFGMHVHRPVTALILATACLVCSACGSGASATISPSSGTTAARNTLARADAALRTSLLAWRARDPALGGRPPAGVLAAAARERSLVHGLSHSPPAKAERVVASLPAGSRQALAAELAAARDLRRLAGPSPGHTTLHLVQPPPAGELLGDYHRAERRFGVPWQVLAAVNLVESAFGRVTNNSSAGAQGPMQFMPATWRGYGLGGNVHSPRDAILGAANYLHRSGSPGDTPRALYAYNPSHLYVEAVLAYAAAMRHDPLAFLSLYAWEASLPSVVVG